MNPIRNGCWVPPLLYERVSSDLGTLRWNNISCSNTTSMWDMTVVICLFYIDDINVMRTGWSISLILYLLITMCISWTRRSSCWVKRTFAVDSFLAIRFWNDVWRLTIYRKDFIFGQKKKEGKHENPISKWHNTKNTLPLRWLIPKRNLLCL